MIKNISTIIVLLFSTLIYSQNVTLIKNNHPKARELKHNLNSSRDSLILSSDNTIVKVEIFNEDFEKTVIVEGLKTQISLTDLPAGKFVVQTSLSDKILIMDIIKYESHKIDNTVSKNKIAEGNGMMLDESLKLIKSPPKSSIEFILTRSKRKKKPTLSQKFYWTVAKVNTESGSNKTMKLVNREAAERMILKNQLENKNSSGKTNELIVWEVYNTKKFMSYQMSNPDFIYSTTSDLFNTSPYYITKNNNQNKQHISR